MIIKIIIKTQTLNKNENENNIKSKKEHSIININININETNLYLGNQKKKSEKEKMYPKIVPKLDINSITKNNRVNSINGHTSKEKKAKNILHLNDLKNIYNNFTERNLIPKDSEDKNKVFINKKFKLMLGLKARNDKLVFQRNLNNRNIGINKVHLTENLNRNNKNDTKSKSQKKNISQLKDSEEKIKFSGLYTERNNYLFDK